MASSTEILQQRYRESLAGLELDALTLHLLSQHLLTGPEAALIRTSQGEEFEQLCRTLAAKGSATLVDVMKSVKTYRTSEGGRAQGGFPLPVGVAPSQPPPPRGEGGGRGEAAAR